MFLGNRPFAGTMESRAFLLTSPRGIGYRPIKRRVIRAPLTGQRLDLQKMNLKI